MNEQYFRNTTGKNYFREPAENYFRNTSNEHGLGEILPVTDTPSRYDDYYSPSASPITPSTNIGTSGDDQLYATPGDGYYWGMGGYNVYNIPDLHMEDITFTELPNGHLEIVTDRYGTDVVDVEGVFIGGDYTFLPSEDIFKPVKTNEGTNYDDILNGTSGLDHVLGKDGNDIIIATPGSDQIDGGYGIDIIAYFGESSYSMNFAGSGGIHVSANSSVYDSDTIKGVEYVAFINGQEIDVVSMANLIA